MLIFLAVCALSAQLLAPYLVFRSRWNVLTHLAAGFCMTAYIIPGLFTDVWLVVPESTILLFTQINVVGAIFVCLGVLSGAHLASRSRSFGEKTSFESDFKSRTLTIRVLMVVGATTIGIYVAYWVMGFIPMFAEDPFAAKQFKGAYRDAYYQVAYLYRFCFSVIAAAMPLVLILAWQKRSPILLSLAGLAFIAILVSLARGATATGLLIFLGVLAARSPQGLKWFIPLVLIIFPFGSTFYYMLGQLLNADPLTSINTGTSLSEFISAGAPDISDQLNWLYGFSRGEYYTYGRTIYGGLIPGNYEWNPSVWTLSYYDIGADISEAVTGGLRLTTAEWGYANFGWYGVAVIPMLSGLFNGFMLIQLKRLQPRLTTIQMTAALVLYATLGMQIVQFYFLSIHNLPAVAAAIYFWRANYVRRRPFQVSFPSGGGINTDLSSAAYSHQNARQQRQRTRLR
jgi:hypothetical protein